MGNLKFVVIIFIAVCYKEQAVADEKVICENVKETISCPEGETLEILSATYGRSSSSVCPYYLPRAMRNTNCNSKRDILSIVKDECSRQTTVSSCTLRPSNGFFRGDPCRGTYKYLTVGFQCKGSGTGVGSSCCTSTCFRRDCKICDQGGMTIDLNQGTIHGSLTGVQVVQRPTPQSGVSHNCSMTALLKASFELPVAQHCRNLLQIHMIFGTGPRKGRMFNFGDSESNNGYAGDSNHQQNDCEIDQPGSSVNVYESDKCGSGMLKQYRNAVAAGVSQSIFWIGNEFYKFRNEVDVNDEVCQKDCLFALADQSDSGPIRGRNRDVYLAFNRVVNGASSRNGYGTCHARIVWKCPMTCENFN